MTDNYIAQRAGLLALGAMYAYDKRGTYFETEQTADSARLAVHVRDPVAQKVGPLAYAHAWAAEWARLGYPTLTLGHTYAAALIATSLSPGDIRAPWPTFRLEVPHGLVTLVNRVGEIESVDAMLVHVDAGRWSWLAPAASVEYSRLVHTLEQLRARVPGDDLLPDCWGVGLEVEEHDERAAECLTRLLLNACVAMSDPAGVRQVGKAHRRHVPGRLEVDAPEARVFELHRKVTVDCRDAVREYMLGHRRSAPKVRWLVRGHWRQQPHGPGRELRRTQWIEPFWKGADTAPVAVRTHELKGQKQ